MVLNGGDQEVLRLDERLELNEAITIENNPRDKSLGKNDLLRGPKIIYLIQPLSSRIDFQKSQTYWDS